MIATQEQRIRALQDEIWIPYPKAEEIRAQLDTLLHHPKIRRMPNLAVIGESNNGKTELLNAFVRNHNPALDPNEESTSLPILMIETPPRPDEGRLYSELLGALNIECASRVAPEWKLDRLRVLLPKLKTKMLILDEFSNALAGSYAAQRQFLNGLKYLGNQLQISIVVAGVPDALAAIRIDPQLSNRFKPAFLPRWSNSPELYARLLLSFETQLGLTKPCDFRSKKVVQRMLDLTGGGILGETSLLLRLLAEDAITTEREIIDIDSLSSENISKIKWTKPEDRTRFSEFSQ
jgi:hypothetical protein